MKSIIFSGDLAQLPENKPDNAHQRNIQIPKLTRKPQVYPCELLKFSEELFQWNLGSGCSVNPAQHCASTGAFIHSSLTLLFLINISSAKFPGEKTARRAVFGLNVI